MEYIPKDRSNVLGNSTEFSSSDVQNILDELLNSPLPTEKLRSAIKDVGKGDLCAYAKLAHEGVSRSTVWSKLLDSKLNYTLQLKVNKWGLVARILNKNTHNAPPDQYSFVQAFNIRHNPALATADVKETTSLGI